MVPSLLKTGIRFAKFTRAIGLIFLFAAASTPHATSAVVSANGFQLKLNGQPFVVKGMNYSPRQGQNPFLQVW
jgi:hypothetical protein